MDYPITELTTRYNRILESIHRIAMQAHRDPEEVSLVVVTKGHRADIARAAIEAGARKLGENYPEEGAEKMQLLQEYDQVEWHMIGHVQSRKARLVSERYAWVHSLDSVKLAQKLDRAAAEGGRVLPALIECNVSGEESKFGFAAWDENTWGKLCLALEPILQLQNIRVFGLMTMAPYSPDAEKARPFFRRLNRLRGYLASEFAGQDWSQLSMGMSADYEVAIQEGATLVRIGEAILGPRPQ